MNQNLKDLIGWWKLKGQREHDPFVKFFFFYVCLDAWITAESGEDKDENKIKYLVETENCLKNRWLDIQSNETTSWLNGLKSSSPIQDMRPRQHASNVFLSDSDNFEEVVRFIYQIRCNLFHGSKDPMNNRDTNLVDLSGRILEKWIVWAHHKC